ncbi:MAG: hypothetical protein K5867_05405 [Bacteroidales bacterium]|jgi:hypothetical protein|nr:hypothetical protein [Bacteroidales bacterium]
MAEMALGYGSEYQLLRYLGHHRNYLNKKIQGVTGSDSPIEWMDYPVDSKRDSKDGEWTGITFLKHLKSTLSLNYGEIEKAWGDFWPKGGTQQSWDGIFVQDKTIYLVEAKAHVEEMRSTPCGANEKSCEIIKKALKSVTKDAKLADSLMNSNLYQLANRIAFVHFLKEHGVTAKLCYIFFLNDKHWKDAVMNKSEYEDLFDSECNKLKLSQNQKTEIIKVYVDAEKDGFDRQR